MIGLGVGIDATVTTQTGKAAAWPSVNSDASDTHLPEPNVSREGIVGPAQPTLNRLPRVGWQGVRGVTSRLQRTGIPLLPKGPSQVARMGPGFAPAGRTPAPVSKVQQFVPVQSVESVGDWYQFLA